MADHPVGDRPLPSSILDDVDKQSAAVKKAQRDRAAQKKKLFRSIFREVKAHRKRDHLPIPKKFSAEKCWKKVASGKFRGADLNGDYIKGLIHRGITEAIESEIRTQIDESAVSRGGIGNIARRMVDDVMGTAAASSSSSESSDSDIEMIPVDRRHSVIKIPGRIATVRAARTAHMAEAVEHMRNVEHARDMEMRATVRENALAPGALAHAPVAVQAQARAPATAAAALAQPRFPPPVPIPIVTGEMMAAIAQRERVAAEARWAAARIRPDAHAPAGAPPLPTQPPPPLVGLAAAVARAAEAAVADIAHARAGPNDDRVRRAVDAVADVIRRNQMDERGLPDDTSIEVIERLFAEKGFGESGPKCPICEDTKSHLFRMSYGCSHEMCGECGGSYIKINMTKEGLRCPGCITEARNTPGYVPKYIDPRIVLCGKIESFKQISFSSFQIPKLQEELDMMEPKTATPQHGSCPLCNTVSMTGSTVLRRCFNPRCCAEFCVNCGTTIGGSAEDRRRHLTMACTEMAVEAKSLAAKPGMVPCTRCGTPLFHAKNHACHHVKCPNCSFEMCHSCGTEWGNPQKCKCPLFCKSDFKCRCAEECDECKSGTKPCVHCNGSCKCCMERTLRPHKTN